MLVLLIDSDDPQYPCRQGFVRFSIDADRAEVAAVGDGGGSITRAVGHAAHDTCWPLGLSALTAEHRCGGQAELTQRLPSAVPDRAELAAPLVHRAGDQLRFPWIQHRVGRVAERLHAGHPARQHFLYHDHRPSPFGAE